MTLSRLLRISRHRVRSVARRDQLDAELRREVAFHFDQSLLLVLVALVACVVPMCRAVNVDPTVTLRYE